MLGQKSRKIPSIKVLKKVEPIKAILDDLRGTFSEFLKFDFYCISKNKFCKKFSNFLQTPPSLLILGPLDHFLLSAQKRQTKGVKNFYPLKPVPWTIHEVCPEKIFEYKIFGKIDFYCILGPFFENLPKFSRTVPSVQISGPSGPKMGKPTPLRNF